MTRFSRTRIAHTLLGLVCFIPACQDPEPTQNAPAPSTLEAPTPTLAEARGSDTVVDKKDTKSAEVGSPAPNFSLPDLDGKTVTLKENVGKVVVLEWFNPECPFVKNAHTKGSLVDTAAHLNEKGVVYLAINSGAPGKQGHGQETNQKSAEQLRMKHPILLDESGAVGRAYGATNTPHIFVIDQKGTLVYRGAVDNSPDGEGQSPKDVELLSYLKQAVDEVLAGKPVSVPETKAYGCSVKFGD